MSHVLSELAAADLAAIWRYVYDESGLEAVADGLLDGIAARFLLLANYPRLGRARNKELGAGARAYPVGNYLIVYEVSGVDVHILRVLHSARDLKAAMHGGDAD